MLLLFPHPTSRDVGFYLLRFIAMIMLQNELKRIVTPEILSSIDVHLLSGLHHRAIPTPSVPAPTLSYACWYLQTVPITCHIPKPCQALHSQRACQAQYKPGKCLFDKNDTSFKDLFV